MTSPDHIAALILASAATLTLLIDNLARWNRRRRANRKATR